MTWCHPRFVCYDSVRQCEVWYALGLRKYYYKPYWEAES